MDDLLSIGRFARLTLLTRKALRLYAERGVLRPAVVDFRTGFRYYRPEQAATAARIRALRALEMPLDDVGTMLAARSPGVPRRCEPCSPGTGGAWKSASGRADKPSASSATWKQRATTL